MSRGDAIDLAVDRRHRPWRRGPFVAITLVILVITLTWLGAAFSFLFTGEAPFDALCSLVCFGVALIGALLPLAIRRQRARRHAVSLVAENDDAAALLRVGRYAEAAEVWERLSADARWTPNIHALVVMNLGVAQILRGDPARAIALLESAKRSGWIQKTMPHYVPNLELGLALAHAVKGDLERAEAHRDAALAALSTAKRSQALLVETMIAARRGTLGDAPSLEMLRDAEASLPPNLIRGVKLLHAFARTGGDGSYRKAEGSEPLDAQKGELDFLSVAWPELRAFMDARGLLADRRDSA